MSKKWSQVILWGGSVGVTSLVLGAIALFALSRQSLKVVQTWKQPNAEMYLSVYESDLDLRSFPLDITRRYSIYIGYDSTPSYGYQVDFSFDDTPSPETDIRQSTVEWSSTGVTFRQPSGRFVFVPKALYEGGR